MRAVLIKDGKGPAENLYIGEADKPSADNGEVLVQVGVSIHDGQPSV
jgi:NADPH:quinone reductase-like Zn-dependent oxidoreductase